MIKIKQNKPVIPSPTKKTSHPQLTKQNIALVNATHNIYSRQQNPHSLLQNHRLKQSDYKTKQYNDFLINNPNKPMQKDFPFTEKSGLGYITSFKSTNYSSSPKSFIHDDIGNSHKSNTTTKKKRPDKNNMNRTIKTGGVNFGAIANFAKGQAGKIKGVASKFAETAKANTGKMKDALEKASETAKSSMSKLANTAEEHANKTKETLDKISENAENISEKYDKLQEGVGSVTNATDELENIQQRTNDIIGNNHENTTVTRDNRGRNNEERNEPNIHDVEKSHNDEMTEDDDKIEAEHDVEYDIPHAKGHAKGHSNGKITDEIYSETSDPIDNDKLIPIEYKRDLDRRIYSTLCNNLNDIFIGNHAQFSSTVNSGIKTILDLETRENKNSFKEAFFKSVDKLFVDEDFNAAMNAKIENRILDTMSEYIINKLDGTPFGDESVAVVKKILKERGGF
jgi:hypothetical protein